MEDTIRTRAIDFTRKHTKEVVAYAIAVASTVVTVSMAFGHKQADAEELIRKVDSLSTKVESVNVTLQQHGEKLAALEATTTMTQNDVRDLKHLADHAQDVAEQFKVPRLTGHRSHR